jgi:fructose-1,6-bisphosphatase II
MEVPQRNLALDLVRVTEAAALASARWLGKGEKEKGDGAAVDAMRLSFKALDIDGTIVIGEGEKDQAPMLYNGEKVGNGKGPKVDVAVDPVEGTNLLAFGRPNAISVVGLSPAGTMYNPGPSFYMKKLVVPAPARDIVDLDAPVADNLKKIAKAMGKDVDDLVVFVLDKPRHRDLVAQIRASGARIQLHTDGDVAGSLMAVDPRSDEVDVMMGTGGTPEGVLSACAIRALGGEMYARLDPQKEEEKRALTLKPESISDRSSLQAIWSTAMTSFSRPQASREALSWLAYAIPAVAQLRTLLSCAPGPARSASSNPSIPGTS